MRKLTYYALYVLSACFITSANAEDKDPNAYAFMTSKDMTQNTSSNITITNGAAQSIAAAGLFIASYDVNDCSACYGNVTGGDNVGGSIASTMTFKPNQKIAIGQNYLYNMLYNGIYFIKQSVGTSPCSLPGCTWPGDDPNVHGWCITINVASMNSNYTYSNFKNGANPPAKFPPYGAAGNFNPYQYKYDLIDPTTLGTGNACLGPITCNDKTLTCKVGNAQNISFKPYA